MSDAPKLRKRTMMSDYRCKHGKAIATQMDAQRWSERDYCVRQGDCQCPICSRVCWDMACLRERDEKEGGDDD